VEWKVCFFPDKFEALITIALKSSVLKLPFISALKNWLWADKFLSLF
jgi:hypothetical protein